MTRLESQAPSILEEKDEIDVFLSPSAPQLKKPRFLSRSDSGHFLLDPRSPRDRNRSLTDSIVPPQDLTTNQVSEIQETDDKITENQNHQTQNGTSFPIPINVPADNEEQQTTNKTSLKSSSTTKLSQKKNVRRFKSEGARFKLDRSVDSIESDDSTGEYHPCIEGMRRFRELSVPQKGQTVSFEPSPYLNSISFTRPFFDEEEELFSEWGLPLTLAKLSFQTLCDFISAILLEKKILVYAKSLRVISALV